MIQHRYGVVSSISASGTPQSALVGIATTPELDIIFDTVTASRKYRNLIERPSCSLVVGSGEQTVQFEGVAEEPRGDDLHRYQQAYLATWPAAAARLNWPGIAYFAIHARWVRYSDYDRNPPLIEEITIQA